MVKMKVSKVLVVALVLVMVLSTASFAASSMNIVQGTPKIDGEIDAVWATANTVKSEIFIGGDASTNNVGEFKALWDEDNYYILAIVKDEVISDASADSYQQDSIDWYLDVANNKTVEYDAIDGQFRANFANVSSVMHRADTSGFVTAAKEIDGGWLVEAKVPFLKKMKAGDVVGIDFQVNNDNDGDGTRDGVSNWAALSGDGWKDTSQFGGEGVLVAAPAAKPATTTTTTANPKTGDDNNVLLFGIIALIAAMTAVFVLKGKKKAASYK